jgi:hypothetical protein
MVYAEHFVILATTVNYQARNMTVSCDKSYWQKATLCHHIQPEFGREKQVQYLPKTKQNLRLRNI